MGPECPPFQSRRLRNANTRLFQAGRVTFTAIAKTNVRLRLRFHSELTTAFGTVSLNFDRKPSQTSARVLSGQSYEQANKGPP